MPLEVATFIDGLEPQNPSSTDQIAEGDNHIRLLKATIKSTFPNIDAAVTPTAAQLNTVPDLAPKDSPVFSGTPTVPTAEAGTNTDQAASCSFVLSNGVPSGAIMMWSGTVATIPTGWLLCDGQNNTPDLRNKFIIGAGDTYAFGATGGSADAVVVGHDHNVTASSTSDSDVNDQGHKHQWAGSEYTGQYDFGRNAPLGNFVNTGDGRNQLVDTSTVFTNITVTTTTSTTVDVQPAGEDGTGKNLPPYFSLAYIMKV